MIGYSTIISVFSVGKRNVDYIYLMYHKIILINVSKHPCPNQIVHINEFLFPNHEKLMATTLVFWKHFKNDKLLINYPMGL